MQPSGRLTFVVALALLGGNTTVAIACPYCNSTTGHQVRATIFGADFVTNLVLVLIPFPILAVLIVLLYFGPTACLRVASARLPWAGHRHVENAEETGEERHVRAAVTE